MQNLYDENYFEKGIEHSISCYSNYRWIPELTIPLAAQIIELLNISEENLILDYGCAKGYLVYAFRLLNRQAFGYDISEYAIEQGKTEIKQYISNTLSNHSVYDWIISKDVFEHVPYEKIDSLLEHLSRICKNMFCIVPLGDGKRYNIPAYELDKTHIIREDIEWWGNRFSNSNFYVERATYLEKNIKENWKKYKHGNGFFTLKSKVELY